MNLSFTPNGWADYLWLHTHEPKLLRKLHRLLDECLRTPFEGTGKPEPLKHEYAGFWSRRLTAEHRLVYAVDNDAITVIACRSHYE
ncbi:Txe/YoeB family addiction module toxin [Deinococcus aquaedulcis]|uniref:Txe/YoeB family addiction module toxin n=1 Tax=Deinococcus aquaedulcis TaxID=2840455 RepID=UPI001C839694|nr:Txe/YoeB family addiction module toxin [Deinococcus aquaedulcis]